MSIHSVTGSGSFPTYPSIEKDSSVWEGRLVQLLDVSRTPLKKLEVDFVEKSALCCFR